MLAEVVRAEELLGLVAFGEFVCVVEMDATGGPVGGGEVGKLFAAVAADVELGKGARWWRRWKTSDGDVGRDGGAWVECFRGVTVEGGAGP
jgi:hypothetical protein